MTTLYKLTKSDGTTYGGCQWGEGVQHLTDGEGDLCGPGWTHWYTHPLLAVLLNPIHGCFDLATALLWEGEGTIGANDHGLKVGCKDGRTLRQMPLPEVTTEQRVKFAILCSLAVKKQWKGKAAYTRWAEAWLDGSDRSEAAAWAAVVAAAEAAAWAAMAARAAEADIDLIAIAEEAVK